MQNTNIGRSFLFYLSQGGIWHTITIYDYVFFRKFSIFGIYSRVFSGLGREFGIYFASVPRNVKFLKIRFEFFKILDFFLTKTLKFSNFSVNLLFVSWFRFLIIYHKIRKIKKVDIFVIYLGIDASNGKMDARLVIWNHENPRKQFSKIFEKRCTHIRVISWCTMWRWYQSYHIYC